MSTNIRINMTKNLAKKLGYFETVYINGSENSNNDPSKSGVSAAQQFDYLIVIDFESTCWEDRNIGWKQPEIIEFPAVLIDIRTGEIEEEFQQYVLPVENRVLSAFCIQFTGIKQEQVENGVPLGTCLLLFNQWISSISEKCGLIFHEKKPGKHACTFVTWSDWDLAICLHNECLRKNIKKPDILCQWIDLKATYKDFYKRRPKGLRGAMSEVGLHFAGREHSGLCDAMNTANLAWRMVQHGAVLKITKVLQPTKKICNSAVKNTIKDHFTVSKNTPKKNGLLNHIETTNSIKISIRQPLKDINTPVTMQDKHLSSKVNLKTQSASSNNDVTKESSTLLNTKVGRGITIHNKLTELQSPQGLINIVTKIAHPKIKNLQNVTAVGCKTPEGTRSFLSTSCKRTPPLCSCGRRAMRKFASLPGPNQGRSFYACAKRKSLGMVHTAGCSFFKWDS